MFSVFQLGLYANSNVQQVTVETAENCYVFFRYQLNSTQLKFIRNKVARRLKDTHENNDDKSGDGVGIWGQLTSMITQRLTAKLYSKRE